MTGLRVLVNSILLIVVLVGSAVCEEYMLGFNEGFKTCKDFENKIFQGETMELAKTSEDGEDTMYMEGYIEFSDDIDEGTMMDLEIAKETERGNEAMWSCSMDVCKSLDDEDAPWAAALQSMNITKCPIAKGKYYCDKFMLDTDFANDKLNHEWEGSYATVMKLKNDKMDVIACYLLGLAIAPKEDDRK